MGGLVKFKLDEKGIGALMTSQEARAVVASAADSGWHDVARVDLPTTFDA